MSRAKRIFQRDSKCMKILVSEDIYFEEFMLNLLNGVKANIVFAVKSSFV